MYDKREKGVYVGRWVDEDLEWEYRCSYVEDINRTIEEYGTNKDWSMAQQVICFSNSPVYKKLPIRAHTVENIFYDTVFPNMTMIEAVNITIKQDVESMEDYLIGELK